jgi:hypothetical protein
VRVQSYLYGDEISAVEKAAKRERCSQSELIRRAVRSYLGTVPTRGVSGRAAGTRPEARFASFPCDFLLQSVLQETSKEAHPPLR